MSSGVYELSCTKSSETRSRLDFAGLWSGNWTLETDINVQGDVPRRGVTFGTTIWTNGDGSYGYAVEVLSTSIEIRSGSNGGGNSSTQLASHTFSPKLAYGWYRLKVVKSGSTYTVSLGGVQYLSVSDSTYTAAAYLALRNRNGETSVSITDQFDNFGVMQAKSGTWTGPSTSIGSITTIAIGSITTIASSIITWDPSLSQGGVIKVETSTDGGTTWKTAANGGPIIGLTQGSSGSGKNVRVRVTLSTTTTATMPNIRKLQWAVLGGYLSSGNRTNLPLAIEVGMRRPSPTRRGMCLNGWVAKQQGIARIVHASN